MSELDLFLMFAVFAVGATIVVPSSFTGADQALVARLDAIAAAVPADTITQTRIENLDRLDAIAAALADGDISAARIAALDGLLSTAALRSGTTGALIVRPSNAAGVNLAGADPAWTNGAWNEYAAAGTLAAHVLVGIAVAAVAGAGTPHVAEVDIGEGGAGSEVVIATFPTYRSADSGISYFIPSFPPRQITANARVAGRIRGDLGVSTAMPVKLIFMPRPF